jgi:hypothetical protein
LLTMFLVYCLIVCLVFACIMFYMVLIA